MRILAVHFVAMAEPDWNLIEIECNDNDAVIS